MPGVLTFHDGRGFTNVWLNWVMAVAAKDLDEIADSIITRCRAATRQW
jgi:hypothetical protein